MAAHLELAVLGGANLCQICVGDVSLLQCVDGLQIAEEYIRLSLSKHATDKQQLRRPTACLVLCERAVRMLDVSDCHDPITRPSMLPEDWTQVLAPVAQPTAPCRACVYLKMASVMRSGAGSPLL